MADSSALEVYIDGAARGNPGPAAYAFVITRSGTPDVEEKGCLGSTTNNQAEYTALVRALEKASQLGAKRLLINSDSELLVKQMNGEYRVKNEGLRELYDQARQLVKHFDAVTLRHVPRAQNHRADALCNEALDGSSPQRADTTRRPRERGRSGSLPDARRDALRQEAVECLRAALNSWGRQDGQRPKPEDVWDQLWSVLEEHGVVST